MKTGYARVSIRHQNLELQLDDLKTYGCETVYKEKVSGKNKSRPRLEQMIDQLRSSDVVVVSGETFILDLNCRFFCFWNRSFCPLFSKCFFDPFINF